MTGARLIERATAVCELGAREHKCYAATRLLHCVDTECCCDCLASIYKARRVASDNACLRG
eukprot:6452074-Amphidinium_carterae.1